MTVNTKAFGPTEVSEQQRLTCDDGLLGFNDIHSFYLIDYPDPNTPFYLLQSDEHTEIAFVLIDPTLIMPDYQLSVSDKDLRQIGVENPSDVLYFSIVTIYDNPQDSTVNLLGPIMINKKNHKAKQMISQNDDYSVRYPLFKGGN
ncbi:MAG: flagellar assembly protein FliW [Spirochaetales bacterium]|nr:flagellar assembly protein FliW [Spirochaetales bacterium]